MRPLKTSTSQSAATAVVGELIRHQISTSRPAANALLARLADGVRAYELEFRGFLNGQTDRPPFELGIVLGTAFQELASMPEHRRALDFRIEALEARFRAAERLFNRRLERGDRRAMGRTSRLAS